MNKLIVAITVSAPLLLLTGCSTVTTAGVDTVVYTPGYTNDYVYAVGYYNNRPYWGNNFYYVASPGYVDWNDGYSAYYNGY